MTSHLRWIGGLGHKQYKVAAKMIHYHHLMICILLVSLLACLNQRYIVLFICQKKVEPLPRLKFLVVTGRTDLQTNLTKEIAENVS